MGSIYSKFWWGSRGGKRKIRWVSWSKLCKPKNQRGLGFKHLTVFNQSLLEKQAWRVLNGPESFAARVLKAKYFRDSYFLSASVKGPRPFSFKPITPESGADIKAADLIDSDLRRWDSRMLDKESVLSISLSWRISNDFLLWHFDKSGVYTVQSGHRVASSISLEAPASNSPVSGNLKLQSTLCLAAIWENKNAFLNCGQSKRAECVVSGADAFLSEFQNSRSTFITSYSSPLSRSPVIWIVPPPDKIKLNFVTGFRANCSSFGIRGDVKGKVLLARCIQMPGNFNHEVGELLALREGLRIANFYNLGVDSIEVASSLNDPSVPLGFSKLIVLDIKALMVDAGICKVQDFQA
ncbi:hypothetical protein Ddye_032191 [Dipteronia dyeriana]|uniref:RNase H type-1 domain-containing protein n=1 Tax=Dipteronia dyeriana TaxID=168575 RepID=A0AAD9TKQ3_9ROSI|nr:hypothetical protein Ddye_032191 [Dipteronia dyeriana]